MLCGSRRSARPTRACSRERSISARSRSAARSRVVCGLGIAALLLGASGPRPAQADEPEDGKPAYENMSLEELLTVPVVVTASRQEEAATEAPATTVVITREEIRLRGYAFLKDVLRDMPGMETQEYGNALYGGTVVPVRGIVGNNKIILLINGVRVNPPGGEVAPLESDFSVRDADQIEIVYGPGSTLYGQDAISAVINVITRRSDEENVRVSRSEARDRVFSPTPMSRRLVSAGVEFGYPLQKEAWGSLNLVFKGARLYGSVHYIDKELTDLSSAYPQFWATQEALAAGRGSPLEPRRLDRGLNAMVRLEYKGASVQIWHRQTERSSSESLVSPPPFAGYIPEARWGSSSTVIEARHLFSISRYFSLQSLVTFNRYTLAPNSRIVFPDFAAPPTQPRWYLNEYKHASGLSATLEERLIFQLAQRLNLVAGFFAGYYDITPLSTVLGGADTAYSVASQGGSIAYYTRQGDPGSRVEILSVNPIAYLNHGGYLEANWRIFRMLRLIVGLRVDKNSTVEAPAFSPRAALIFNYQSFTAKYIFARAFVAPTPADKYLIFAPPGQIHGPNPSLLPETAISNELHLGFNNRHLSFGASLYYNLQDNLVQQYPDLSTGQPVWTDPQGTNQVALTKTVNSGSSWAAGADFFGKFNIWKLSGWASYSFTNAAAQRDKVIVPLTGISAHNVRLGVTASVLKNLHITAGAIVRSAPANQIEPMELAGVLGTPYELNAHVLYSPIPSIDVYADFRNLTNNKYYLNSAPYPAQAFQGSGGLRLSF